MSQKHVLVEHLSNINSVIKQPLQLTQRIKFTAFDVSQNYIVFGATSGGLYVFNRYPHVFIKLIPSKQGPVLQVSLSPNEKAIVLTSSRGLVTILQNCFSESNLQYQVYSEHEGSLVTAVKWHIDELYCGDNKGKVSVITLPNLLTKAIFQTPCAALMQLDSSVVQIECYSKFLLISTYTRTYICDTEKEQYRQIGKKLRDGVFGACFFSSCVDPDITSAHASTSRGLFKNVKDDVQFITHVSDSVKIFCARPGARMWEAKLDASVTRTHQFKNFLKGKPTNVVHLDDDPDAHLRIDDFSGSEASRLELFNFSKVFILGNKFVFTFSSDGFYVFDPETVEMICWCICFKNIRDIKIVNNFMYIWKHNAELCVVAVYDLEKIILKTLFDKQYYACSELCVNYIEEVLGFVETSERIHLVSILKEKLAELAAEELQAKLAPLFMAIQGFSAKKCSSQRLATGIVIVNNSFRGKDEFYDDVIESKCERDQLPETLQTLKEIGSNVTEKFTESTKTFKEKLQILETTVKNLTRDANTASVTQKYFYQQYEMSKINSNLEIPTFNELLFSGSLDAVMNLFLRFKEHMLEKEVNEANIKMWCYKEYLKHCSKRDFQNEIADMSTAAPALLFLSQAFRALNFSPESGCVCLFPLPVAKTKMPEYYNVGCTLVKKFWSTQHESFKEIPKEVPFMWKYIIEDLRNDDNITILLPLLIQFGDEDLIEIFLKQFKYDIWDSAVQLLIKLRKGMCLNCDNNFEKDCNVISWTKLGTLMVQSVGGPSAIKLLMRFAHFVPPSELDSSFYQSCIFATVADQVFEGFRDKAINFTRTVAADEDSTSQFDSMMVKFLQKPGVKSPPKCFKNSITPVQKTDLKCSICDLPLEIPLLKSNVKLECSHLFHVICLKHNKGICTKCNKSA